VRRHSRHAAGGGREAEPKAKRQAKPHAWVRGGGGGAGMARTVPARRRERRAEKSRKIPKS